MLGLLHLGCEGFPCRAGQTCVTAGGSHEGRGMFVRVKHVLGTTSQRRKQAHRLALITLSRLLLAKAEQRIRGAGRGKGGEGYQRRKARLAAAHALLLLLGAHNQRGAAAIRAASAADQPAGRVAR